MSAPLRPTIQGVPIAWGETPFAAFGGRLHLVERPSGLTIADMVASIPDLPDGFCMFGTVCINGDVVPRRLWHRVRAKRPSALTPVSVTLHMPVRDAGTRRILALVATVALLAASLAISGGALAPLLGAAFLSGHIGATLLAAGVSLAGSLLLAALTPPPVIPSAQGAGDESKGSAAADNNLIDIGGPLPRVCGTFRVFPPPICEPVIEIVGENEIVTQVYALAGPHAWSDIRLGGADIESADDISVETREGWLSDPPLTLITRQAKVQVLQAELSAPLYDPADNDAQYNDGAGIWRLRDQLSPDSDLTTWTPAVSRNAPDEIWLHVYWPQGMANPYDLTQKVGVPIRTRIRRRGDANWINLPELHFHDHKTSLLRKAIKIVWGTAPSPLPTPPSDHGPVYAYKLTPQQAVSPTATAPAGWTAHSNFSSGAGSDLMYASALGNVRNVALYDDRAEFYLDETTFPKGVYEIEVRRGAMYHADKAASSFEPTTYVYTNVLTGIYDFFYYTDGAGGGTIYRALHPGLNAPSQVFLARVISIWNESPVPKPGNALLCVQAQNRALSQVSALASGYVRDWNGEAWQTWLTTSNPAPHFRDVLAGDLVTRQVPSVDDDQIVEWRDHCEDRGYTCDAILDGRSMGEALNLLAAGGFARPRKSERWGVIVDKDRSADAPSQIFGPRNLANFRMEKAFADLPDGFTVTYRDRDLDYQVNQIVVYRNGFGPGNARRLESVDYIGPVTEDGARARAEFDLAQAEARATFYYGDADVDSIVTETGDLVGVQHDILSHYAGFARIKEVTKSGSNITGLVLDSKIPLTTPDDIAAVQDIAGLSNVEGAVMSEEISELADISAAADITEATTAPIGVAIRCVDGTIVTKAVVAQSEDSATIAFLVPFADPGTILEDCLLHSGTLGREYRRLILREAVPGRDVTAALTFVDEAPELWLAAA